jgi:hypothetical protein
LVARLAASNFHHASAQATQRRDDIVAPFLILHGRKLAPGDQQAGKHTIFDLVVSLGQITQAADNAEHQLLTPV